MHHSQSSWLNSHEKVFCTLILSLLDDQMHSEDKSQKITFPLFFCCNSILSHQVNKNVILSLKISGLLQKHFYLKKNICHTWLILITSGRDVLTENLWKHWSSHAGSWQGRSFLFTRLRCHLCFISCAIRFKAFTLKHMA